MRRFGALGVASMLIVGGCGDDAAAPLGIDDPGSDAGTSEDGSVLDVGLDGGMTDASSGLDGGSDAGVMDAMPLPLSPNEIRIESMQTRQTMDGIGANTYGYPFVDGAEVDGRRWDAPAVRAQLRTLDIAYIRMVPWTDWWEPQNDNDDPAVTLWGNLMNNPDGFDIRSAEWFELPAMQWIRDEGIPQFVGVWHAPPWLQDEVDAGRYEEAAESVVSYYQFARTGELGASRVTPAGVPLEVLEVQNEPDLEFYLSYPTPEALRDGALAILDRLDAVGLNEVQVHGPNIAQIRTSTTELLFTAEEWIRPWLEDPRLRSRTAAVSYHTWWSDERGDYRRVRNLARRYDKPVWATEVGLCAVDEDWCAFLGYSRFNEELWGSTLDFVEASYRAVAWSEATRVYMWAIAGANGALRTDGSTTAHYAGLRHLANYIPPESVHVDVARGPGLGPEHPRALGFVQPSGDRALILLNRATLSSTVSIRGQNGRRLRIVAGLQSTELAPLRDFVPDLGEVVLPPRSMTSLVLR